MTNKKLSTISLIMLYAYSTYIMYLLGFNKYTYDSIISFAIISVLGVLFFAGAFVYFRFIAKDIYKIKEVNEDDVKHFVQDKQEQSSKKKDATPSQNEPKVEKEIVSESPDTKLQYEEGSVKESFFEEEDSLHRALSALEQTNELDSDIKRNF